MSRALGATGAIGNKLYPVPFQRDVAALTIKTISVRELVAWSAARGQAIDDMTLAH